MDMDAICISHSEDADGLICAAYSKHLLNASTLLVSYDDLEKTLKAVNPPVNTVYICDLNIREELCEEIERIAQFATVTFIDHHPTSPEVLERLQNSGVNVIYSLKDCSSVLLYDLHQKKLRGKEARLAAYAAISDHFEAGHLAQKLLIRFDQHFIQHEALILTHALNCQPIPQFRSLIVQELSEFSFPHKIKGTIEAAIKYLEQTTTLLEQLPEKAVRLQELAYVEAVPGLKIGAIASLLIDAMNVDVGVCYKNGEVGFVNFSIRGRGNLQFHLGEITQELAKKHAGFGGGHQRASGASIPKNAFLAFIKDIELAIRRTPNQS